MTRYTTKATPEPVKLPTLATSDMRQLHSMSGIVGDALQSVPEWRTAAEALHALHGLGSALRTPEDPVAELAEHLTATLSAGEPVGDLLATAADYAARNESRRIARLALVAAQVRLELDLDEAARSATGVMFEALATEFAQILDGVRGIENPSQLASAEAAIDAGRADDWTTWRDLLERHAQVRQQQGKLMRLTGVATPFEEAAYLRGAETHLAHWVQYHRDGAQLYDPNDPNHAEPIVAPWPAGNDYRITPGLAGSPAFLSWALGANVELWLPTPDELGAEVARLNDLMAGHSRPLDPAARRREQARVRASVAGAH